MSNHHLCQLAASFSQSSNSLLLQLAGQKPPTSEATASAAKSRINFRIEVISLGEMVGMERSNKKGV